ncbi:protein STRICTOSIDINE SYNTHASE-LIKE 11-like [Mercurialis annua]|uniref:protein STRICTOSIDINE SYNTHASE-LIKE 11-like n=1 Tax=Mercurialis annua TaxID=3986 RepID=UPI0024ACD046|nr:protein STRICTOSIDINE SYNTHASE-LIKE 11-like [Mercurialis annua]
MALTVFNIFFILFSLLPYFSFSYTFSRLNLPSPAMGPDSTAFDAHGQGPYTGVADGRILKYQAPNVGFQDYAFDTPNRSKAVCDGNSNPILGNVCGRPLGLGFLRSTGQLFIADAYLGLLVVGTNGRLARSIATGAEGVPFRFTDALDIDQLSSTVFFTDASAIYNLGEITLAVATNDSTGRLLKYDPKTQNVTVLLRNLSGPVGVAVSVGGKYLLFTEFIGKRIQKYWLKGPKANTSEVLLTLPGNPDNIKRTPSGDTFWVALNVQQSAQINVPTAVKIDGLGRILRNISLSQDYNSTLISEVHEPVVGKLYIGSLFTNFLGVVKNI